MCVLHMCVSVEGRGMEEGEDKERRKEEKREGREEERGGNQIITPHPPNNPV